MTQDRIEPNDWETRAEMDRWEVEERELDELCEAEFQQDYEEAVREETRALGTMHKDQP